jgi:membrane dipeptidase
MDTSRSSRLPLPFAIDGHADTAQRFLDEGWDFTRALDGGMLNLETAQAGGLGAEFFAIWVDPKEYPEDPADRALKLLDAVHAQVERHPDKLALCTSSAEILAAREAGRFGVLLGLEGGHAIQNDLQLLARFHALGVRYMTLTWSHSVGWADSCGDAADPAVVRAHGLSSFGREVIAEMNRLGMIVDVSHVSDETFWSVLDCSRAPVIASHSSARALTQAPRNLTDKQLRALRDKDGLAMVNFFPAFLDEAWRNAWNRQQPERESAHLAAAAPFRARQVPVPFAVSNAVDRKFAALLPPASLDALLDHLEHMVRVAGPGHIGLGSDFDGIPALPAGMHSAADLPKLVTGLRERGFAPEVIDGVFAGNLLRVLDAVQAVASHGRIH